MNQDKSKSNPPEGEWWTGLVEGLKFHTNSGLPLSEEYWANLHDKIMAKIDEPEPLDPGFIKQKKLEKLSELLG